MARTPRTPLRQRKLPDYTNGEEAFNSLSHLLGAVIGVVVLVACVIRSAQHGDAWAVVGSAIYGASVILLFAMSGIYHGVRAEKAETAKLVLQVIDHCTIYIFIAGTYTPIMLSALRPVHPGWAWGILGGVWALAAMAIVFTAIDLKKYAVFSMICYIGMGWCIILGIKPLIEVLAKPGLWMLVSGGVTYTIGAVLYGIGSKKRYIHSLFHLFVVAGSVLHALCIFFYVL